jgi:predicted DNA-binding transcriptional regulator YafY
LDKEAYIENTFSDFNEYFEDMIGVTKYEDRESRLIKLWFESEQAHYIDTKPLHGTQKLTWQSNGSAIVTIEVIPNMELEHLILRFGEKCKVLEPIELVSKISERLKLASDSYH